MSRIVLGTVQFGLNYGVANKTGKPSKQEIEKIDEKLDRLPKMMTVLTGKLK